MQKALLLVLDGHAGDSECDIDHSDGRAFRSRRAAQTLTSISIYCMSCERLRQDRRQSSIHPSIHSFGQYVMHGQSR